MVKQGPSAGPSGSEARLDPAIADIARSLPVLLRHLHAQARAQSPGGLQLDGPGAFALWLLHARGPLTAGELAQRLRITPAGVTALVARLGGGGYVQSTADLEDRRRKRVTITPAGRAAMREMNGWWRTALGEVFGRLPPEDTRALGGVLRRLAAVLEADDP